MGDCSCVYVDFDGYWECSSSVMRKARKEHKCSECGRTIERGEKYNYFSGKWEGSFDDSKTCVDCLSVIKVFFCNGAGIGAMYDELYRHVLCNDGVISSDCIVPLTPRAREKVCGIIEQAWETLDVRKVQWEKMRERKTDNIHG